MNATQMYWIIMLDHFVGAALFIAVVSSLILGLSLFFRAMQLEDAYDREDKGRIKRTWRPRTAWLILAILISSLVATFLPSTKEAAVIIAVPKVCEVANRLPLEEAVHAWLEEVTKTSQPAKEGGK